MVEITFKLVKEDGTDIGVLDPTTDAVTCVNAPAISLIRQVQVFLGPRCLADSGPAYGYRGYVTSLVSYSGEFKQSAMTLAGYRKEVSKQSTDPGYQWRVAKTQNSQPWTVSAPLFIEPFTQNLALLPYSDLKVVIFPTESGVDVRKGNGKYRVKILDIKLTVEELYPNESLLLSIEQLLRERKLVSIPMPSVLVRTFVIPGGRRVIPEARLGLAKLPRRVVVGLVNCEAYNGNPSHPPFYFETAGLKNLTFQAGTQVYPFRPFENNFAQLHYARAYLSLLEGMGMSFGSGDCGSGISIDDYISGHCLYVFDLAGAADNDADLSKNGDASLRLEFEDDTRANGYYCIVFLENQSVLNINAERECSVDTMI